MSSNPKISETEWLVMKTLWLKSPKTANQVIQDLEGTVEWSPKTVRTLLSRLVKKGALNYNQEGREYLYFPTVTEEESAKQETNTFLQKVHGGMLNSMLASFIKEQSLSKTDIDELKHLLDEKDA